jgi:hypothetical protein
MNEISVGESDIRTMSALVTQIASLQRPPIIMRLMARSANLLQAKTINGIQTNNGKTTMVHIEGD